MRDVLRFSNIIFFYSVLCLSLFFGVACQTQSGIDIQNHVQATAPTTTPADQISAAQEVKTITTDCRSVLSEFNESLKVTEAPDGEILLVSPKALEADVSRLPEWGVHLSEFLYLKHGCSWPRIRVEWEGDDGRLVRFILFRDNFDLYRQQKISLPEFGRRLEVVQVDTLESIKTKLRGMRQQKNHQEALEWVQKWLDVEPESVVALVLRGNIFLEMGETVKAIEAYESALKLNPQDVTARFNLAVAQKEIGSFTESLTAFENLNVEFALSGDQRRDLLRMHLMDAHLRNNEPEKARLILEALTAIHPDDLPLWQAQMLRSQKKYQEARDVLVEYLKEHPKARLAQFNQVVSELDLKDEAGARGAFEKLKQLDADLARELEFIPLFKTMSTVAPVVTPQDNQEFLDE